MTRDERLALMVAVEKAIKPQVADAKAEAKADLLEAYGMDHTDRRALVVGDEKVGEVGIVRRPPKPRIAPGHEAEALSYLRAKGLTVEVPAEGWEKRFSEAANHAYDVETGEMVGFLDWGEPTLSASVRGCKPEDVAAAFGARLGSASVAGLLGGE